ncbi:MAG: Gfo/Idh/MocA family oxidoreductase [Lentisphaerae bacterium]|nr:Gfo/Idh/MocA family oxidoreductase [Lentisphaerota bacterium]
MKAGETLRAVITGMKHGGEHAHNIAARGDMKLVGVCDLDAGRARAALAHEQIADVPVYTDHETMLKEAAPDVAVIATPVALHAAMAIAALQKGCHVLVEKPLATTLEDAHAVRRARDAAGTVCQVGYEKLSSPLMHEVERIIAAGRLGELVVMWAHEFRDVVNIASCAWRFRREDTWGMFFDCQIHQFSLMMKLAGADFHRVCAFGGPKGRCGPHETALPETVSASIEFANGIRASAALSQISQTHQNDMFGFVGTDGRIEVDPYFPEGPGSFKLYTAHGLYKTHTVVDGHKASHGHIGSTEQYDRLVDSIRTGAPVAADLRNAIDTQRLMKAFELSLAEGRIVKREEFTL